MSFRPDQPLTTRRVGSRAAFALLGVLLSFGLVSAACSSNDSDTSATTSTSTTAAAQKVTGDVTVSAAASLKETFTKIGKDFEAANPGSKITINFGSSGDLATQIQSGAPVDVAAFAAESNMTTLADASLLDGKSEVFATNSLVIVTKPGNPKKIKGLSDLATVAESGGTISLCATTAPCGKYADQILQTAKVTIPADKVTRGQDVRATLSAVTDGDADAAIVYVTDAQAAGDSVDSVEIPTEQNAVAKYPIAVIKATTNASASTAFMSYVLGPEAQKVLSDAGFGAP